MNAVFIKLEYMLVEIVKNYSRFDLFLMAHCQGSFALELLKEEILTH